MVRAFLLLALGGADPPAPPGPAPCRVLYARNFGTPPETPPGTGDPPRQRLRRKEQLLAVARQVSSQCRLLQSSLGHPPAPQVPPVPDDPLQDALGGFFQLPPGDPFPGKVTVAWFSAVTLALALICDPHENLSLAELTLRRHLAPRLLTPQQLLGPPHILLRPDALHGLLDRLLPHGEMLFLNQRFLQALEREGGGKSSR